MNDTIDAKKFITFTLVVDTIPENLFVAAVRPLLVCLATVPAKAIAAV